MGPVKAENSWGLSKLKYMQPELEISVPENE